MNLVQQPAGSESIRPAAGVAYGLGWFSVHGTVLVPLRPLKGNLVEQVSTKLPVMSGKS